MAAPVMDASPEPLPGDLAELAHREGLGAHRATFRPKRAGFWRMTGILVFCVLGLLCFVVPGLLFLWIAAQTPNLSRKQAAKRMHFFEHGIIVSDTIRRNAAPVAFRWAEVMTLQQITKRYANGVYVGTTYVYTLHKRDGSTAKLTQFYDRPDWWGPVIQQEIVRAQLPGMLAMLEQGQTVTYGDLSVNRGGIATAGRGGVAWHEIESVEVQNGALILRRAGKMLSWSTIPVAKIPNFILFMALVQELRRQSV